MELLGQVWDFLSKVPATLLQYEAYPRWLLYVLLAAGVLGTGALLVAKFKFKQAPKAGWWALGLLFAFFSSGALYGQEMARREQRLAHEAFIHAHRFGAGQAGLVVFDFNVPLEADAARRKQLLGHMPLLVHTVSDVLVDDLPAEFALPRVLGVSSANGPWQEVTQQNFTDIIERLNAVQIMWGDIYSSQAGARAKVSLGMRTDPQIELDAVIPLRDVQLDEDPRAGNQFGDGRFQLLGAVTLAMALQTYGSAQHAAPDQRRPLFLKAAQQIAKAREALNSRSDEPVLRRTLYSEKVTALLANALKEAGVQP